MEIKPITLRQASDYINENHRHLKQICGENFVPWEGRYRGDGAG